MGKTRLFMYVIYLMVDREMGLVRLLKVKNITDGLVSGRMGTNFQP